MSNAFYASVKNVFCYALFVVNSLRSQGMVSATLFSFVSPMSLKLKKQILHYQARCAMPWLTGFPPPPEAAVLAISMKI